MSSEYSLNIPNKKNYLKQIKTSIVNAIDEETFIKSNTYVLKSIMKALVNIFLI